MMHPVNGHTAETMADSMMGLGISAATVRRIIAAGTLEVGCGEVHNPCDEWLSGSPVRSNEAVGAMIATTLRTGLAPLVAEITASRQTNERRSDQLIAQAEMIGQLRAELFAERAQHAILGASGATEAPAHPTHTAACGPWWRRF
jgi:hypothetical protein